jgi:hypothetical protein
MTSETQRMSYPPVPPGLQEKLLVSVQQPGEKAALAVLIVHGRWLGHPGFLLACVQSFRGQQWIVWRMVQPFLARTPCPELDAEILRMAAELALSGSGRRLDESAVLRQVDDQTRDRLVQAIGSQLRTAVSPGRQPADARDTPLELADQVLRWARQGARHDHTCPAVGRDALAYGPNVRGGVSCPDEGQ